MHRVICLLLLAAPAFAQSGSTDSQLTQALLTEIRLLRQDLQTTAITIQRVQIVMYRLQAETTLMSRATLRLDDARSKCSQAQVQRKNMATEIERTEERQRSTQDPAERKQAEQTLPRLKGGLEMWTNEEQQCQAREAEAETQFRAEQAKLNELQDQLDKLDKVLAGYTGK
jgi:chromosome segregation ATPase